MRETADAIVLANLFEFDSQIDSIAWQPFREGVEIFPLYKDEHTEASAALLRYQPGAKVPAHAHSGYEHILVLHGSQEDERGRYTKGSLVVNKPDSRHSVKSVDGCVVLAIWQYPVKFL